MQLKVIITLPQYQVSEKLNHLNVISLIRRLAKAAGFPPTSIEGKTSIELLSHIARMTSRRETIDNNKT